MRPMRLSGSTVTSSEQALGQSCGQADLRRSGATSMGVLANQNEYAIMPPSFGRACLAASGKLHLLVRPRLRHQRGGLQPVVNLGDRGLYVGDRQAMGWRDGSDAKPL